MFLGRARGRGPFGRDAGDIGMLFLGVFPRLDQPLGQIAAAWTRNAPEPQAMSQIFRSSSSLADGASTPPSASPRRADVDERLQRVLDDGLGQAAGRVVRAGGSAVGSRGDVDTSLADDHRLVERVVADQARERLHPVEQAAFVAAGRPDLLGGVSLHRAVQRFLQGVLRPARLLVQELEQVRLALGPEPLQFRQGDFRLVPLGADQAQHGSVARLAVWSSRPS